MAYSVILIISKVSIIIYFLIFLLKINFFYQLGLLLFNILPLTTTLSHSDKYSAQLRLLSVPSENKIAISYLHYTQLILCSSRYPMQTREIPFSRWHTIAKMAVAIKIYRGVVAHFLISIENWQLNGPPNAKPASPNKIMQRAIDDLSTGRKQNMSQRRAMRASIRWFRVFSVNICLQAISLCRKTPIGIKKM